jgi:hypothetical protein
LRDISPDGWLTDWVFGMFRFQPGPDPVRRVSLFARCFQIQLQYPLDLIFNRTKSRLLSFRSLSDRRNRCADRLPDHAPVNSVLCRQPLYRFSGRMPSPDLFE